jgi:hypothetical protein
MWCQSEASHNTMKLTLQWSRTVVLYVATYYNGRLFQAC